jgi:hypothetical protein
VRRERLGEGVSAGGVVVSGNHLPNPLPPRVRRHSSTAQTPAKRVRHSREHARGSRGWQCRLRGTPRPPDRGRHRVTDRGGHPPATEPHHRVTTRRVTTAPGSGGAPAPAPPDRPHPSPPPTGPRPVWSAGRCSAACPHRPPSWRTAHPPALPAPSLPASRVGTAACRILLRRSEHVAAHRTEGRTGEVARRGRAPVERLNPAHATVYFQPTSHPCRFLGELADQPPCHQARRDHAVRFHPIGTGHEREAHFPARPRGGTLRDRMLPAKWPCRHSAGWSTCHDGTTKRSRFDLGCRILGTRARPRGNVQERQARKDQEDANTEGGLAS